MSAPGGEPAFPQPMFVGPDGKQDWPSNGWGLGGLTLRGYFAGQALAGMLATEGGECDSCYAPSAAAARACEMADALVAELAKGGAK